MFENVFTTILTMSITASVVAVLITCFRLIFSNKLPKIFSYALWIIVLVRLLIPFSFTSIFSIFNILPTLEVTTTQSLQYNGKDNSISYDTGDRSITQENTVSESLNNNIASSFSETTREASDELMEVISWIWLVGAIGLFSFSIYAYFRTSYRLKEAALYKHNGLISESSQKLKLKRKIQVYISDRIHTPVVCGLIHVRIILPLAIAQDCNELELKHIITHELVHINRFDYILKPLWMLALCVHWFNPVIWLSFILSQKDMEMSCDEKVMSICDIDIRSEYAALLIKLVAKQNMLLNGGLLAFGESNIKSRIKGIMNFKKPGFWLSTLAIVILIASSMALLTNGQYKEIYRGDFNSNNQLEAAITQYYLKILPENKGVLKIYNIKKYDNGYLALTEKYEGEGESHSELLLIDSGFKIVATAPGNVPISPCFSANVVGNEGKSIVYGNFKNKKWEPQTDTVVDVQIDEIKITFEDGTVFEEPVSMDKGYIIVVETISKIKNIEVYKKEGVLQSDLSETFCSEYSFRRVEEIIGYQEDESKNSTTVFDKTEVKEYWLETVVINDCLIKDGPGDNYKTVGNLKYGDIVFANGKYDDWVLCSNNGVNQEFWVKSTDLIDEKQHRDYNLGVITANEVKVGTVTLSKGNLVQVLKTDKDKSCVTIRVIDINVGITGWINNTDYTMAKSDILYNQAYLKKGTLIYKQPSLDSQLVDDYEAKEFELFVNINKEQDGWVSISSYGPIDGWVQKENVHIPMSVSEE